MKRRREKINKNCIRLRHLFVLGEQTWRGGVSSSVEIMLLRSADNGYNPGQIGSIGGRRRADDDEEDAQSGLVPLWSRPAGKVAAG